jgi:two-component system chemotaxis sensor kinase CheA
LNTQDYKELFLTEARDYLSTLNNALVALEKDPAHSEAVREIFRAAHTLKGMSATMGYAPMTTLAHQMETAMEPVRSGASRLSPDLVDTLFACLDRLDSWVKELESGGEIAEESVGNLLERLSSSPGPSAGGPTTPPPPTHPNLSAFVFDENEKMILAQARVNGFSIFRLLVRFEAECVFKEVRAFMVLKNVNGLGEVVKSNPPGSAVEKGEFDRSFELVLVTENPAEKIKDAVLSVAEVEAAEVSPFDPSTLQPTDSGEFALSGGMPVPKGSDSTPAPDEKGFTLPTIRVHTSKLDKLMTLVQELVISKIRFEMVAAGGEVKELREPLAQLHHITEELQDEIMKVRLIPVKQVFDRFPRMVRDLAKSLGKQVNLEMEGAEVELDRTVIDEIGEPLVHLLRNAVDHGVEVPEERARDGKDPFGTIRLQAKRERSSVILSVTDDGQGIDPDKVRQHAVSKELITAEEAGKLTDEEAVRLISLPGFSLAERATEVSGRGVGVDAAKTKVESMGGSFRIQSRKGVGTTFFLRFPLTLAIIKALLVKVGGETFALPVTGVLETLEIHPSEKRRLQLQETIMLRDEVLPLYHLGELLEVESSAPPQELESVVVVEVGESRVGLLVDSITGQNEIAIKPLDRFLKKIRGFAGATVLGDGRIALVLDVNSLIEDLRERRYRVEHSLPGRENAHALES